MIQYLPQNLNLDAIVALNPPDFKYHKDYFVYILNLITEIPSKDKKLISRYGYVPFNANLLSKRIRDYKNYLDYLLKHGVLETDNCYIPGEKSKGFRFAKEYQTIIVPVPITKFTLTKSIRTRGKFDRNMKRRYDFLFKWFDEGLQIDAEKAARYLEKRYILDRLNLEDHPVAKLNHRMMNLLKLNSQDWYFRIDDTGGRLHTNLTVLKKELRNYLTFQGRQLSTADIKCSQPNLSLVILDPRFYEKDDSGFASLHRIYPALAKTLPIEKIVAEVKAAQDQFGAYRKAVGSDLYEYLKLHLSGLPDKIINDRDKLKDLTFSVLYSDNRFIAQQEAAPKRKFKELFPEVYEIFSQFKKKDKAALAILLQRIESELILNRAAKIFAKQNPSCPLYTIHDSITVESSFYDVACEILLSEGQKFCGLNLKVKREDWKHPDEQ